MQSLGADENQIVKRICGIVLLISIGLVIVGESVLPFLNYAAEQMKCQQQSSLKKVSVLEGSKTGIKKVIGLSTIG